MLIGPIVAGCSVLGVIVAAGCFISSKRCAVRELKRIKAASADKSEIIRDLHDKMAYWGKNFDNKTTEYAAVISKYSQEIENYEVMLSEKSNNIAALEKSIRKLDDKIAEMSKENKRLSSKVGEYEHLREANATYLAVMEERYGDGDWPLHPYKRAVSIVLRSKVDPQVFFIVKNFWFDNRDQEDYEFAKREAEDLLETIQKA